MKIKTKNYEVEVTISEVNKGEAYIQIEDCNSKKTAKQKGNDVQIHWEKKVPVIKINNGTFFEQIKEKAKAEGKNTKKWRECYLLISQEEYKNLRAMIEEEKQKAREVEIKRICEYKGEVTISDHSSYNARVDFSDFSTFLKIEEVRKDAKKMRAIINTLGRDVIFHYRDKGWGEYKYYEGDYTDEISLTISFEQFQQIIAEQEKELEKALEAKKQKKLQSEAERQAKFEEAKRTGKKVKLYSYADDCNDENEDCDIDTIIVYAMPNGSIQEERHHNW
ncbi:MAG: hypothetical protein AB1472_03805 [Candidatus Omnitrophota bacterium]